MQAANATNIPRFTYQGPVLQSSDLKYSPHPDIIHPSVIATRPQLPTAAAAYYMYYAPHDAPGGICLAMADDPAGPWREYPHNPLITHQWLPHYSVSHVSSPHAIWNPIANALFLYFHGENDTTHYAVSHNGIDFEYGGVAVTTASFEPGLSEASYARVFYNANIAAKGPFRMLIMGNHNGCRKVYLAWSADGRHWTTQPGALLQPPPGSNQMGPGWLFSWQQRWFIIAFANHSDAATYDPISDLILYEVNGDLSEVQYLGVIIDHGVAGADNRRINDPCLIETETQLCLFVNSGKRLNQHIALATAPRQAR